MLYEITKAVAHPNHTVAITWSDGANAIVDFEPYIARGGLFSALKDPDYFTGKMHVLRNGMGLAWPNEVDFSADGLRYDAFPKDQSGEFDDSALPPKSKSTEKSSDRPR